MSALAITVRAFLGDAERDFALTSPMLAELERKTGFGILELFGRIGRQTFVAAELSEIIRFALVGAGDSPVEAHRLVGRYVEDRPIMETVSLAFAILDVRINGREAQPSTKPAAEPEPAPAPKPGLSPDEVSKLANEWSQAADRVAVEPQPEPPVPVPVAPAPVVDTHADFAIGSE